MCFLAAQRGGATVGFAVYHDHGHTELLVYTVAEEELIYTAQAFRKLFTASPF